MRNRKSEKPPENLTKAGLKAWKAGDLPGTQVPVNKSRGKCNILIKVFNHETGESIEAEINSDRVFSGKAVLNHLRLAAGLDPLPMSRPSRIFPPIKHYQLMIRSLELKNANPAALTILTCV